MVRYEDLRHGQRVQVRAREGGYRQGTIDEVSPDIKNGIPGIGYVDDVGRGFWCYLDQIAAIAPSGTREAA